MRQAQREYHVAGLEVRRETCGSRRRDDAFAVQMHEQALTLDELEADVHVAAEPLVFWPVQPRIRNFEQVRYEIIAHLHHLDIVFLIREREQTSWDDVLPDREVEQEVLSILDGQGSETR